MLFINNLKPLAFILMLCLFSCQTLQSQNDSKQSKIFKKKVEMISRHINEGNPQKALIIVQPLAKDHPDNVEVLTMHGLTHLALRNYQKSWQSLSKAHKLDNSIQTGLNLTAPLIEGKKYLWAMKLLKKLEKREDFETYKFKERVHHNMGVISEKKGLLQSAVKHYRAALQENPAYYMSIINLAKVQLSLSQTQQGVKNLLTARRFCSKCYEPVKILAKLNASRGMKTKANEIINEYLKIKGLHPTDIKLARQYQRTLKR